MKRILLLTLLLLMSSCSSVNVRTDDQKEEERPPTFQQRYSYWWWGFHGEHSINVREICIEKPVKQMQAVYTISDSLFNLFTLGIYAPRTARVWCGEKEQ